MGNLGPKRAVRAPAVRLAIVTSAVIGRKASPVASGE
jgi:hypothetical protein